ncbi:type IV pilin [Halobacteriales archaeon QH_9_66_26]|nr:MAG: type IV pilin [Halobacteriales archaeon QH_9_66_26]
MRLFDSLSEDDRAVSPVIGVVLMIAVVVILAAVVGAFATGVFGGQTDAPQAAFSYNDGTVTMDSGENIPNSQLEVEGSGSFDGDPVTAGDSASPVSDTDGDGDIEVTWNSSDGGNSAVLGRFDA